MQEKMAGRGQRRRFVSIHERHPLRATGPGDVIVGKEEAWMLQPDLTPMLLSTQLGPHPDNTYVLQGAVSSISWSPTGRYLATGDRTGTVLIYSLLSRAATASYQYGRCEDVAAVAWSPNGKRMAAAIGFDGDIHVWTVVPEAGYRQAALGSILICRDQLAGYEHRFSHGLVWLPDSWSLCAGRIDGRVLHWDSATGACLSWVQRHEDEVTDVALCPDGTRIASASGDGSIRIGSLADPLAAEQSYQGHSSRVTAVDWSPDGSLLVSGAQQENCLHLWDATTAQACARLPLSVYSTRPFTIKAVRWSPTGTLIAAGCENGTVQVFDARRHRHVVTYRPEGCEYIGTLAWSADGTFLAAGGREGYHSHRVYVWQVEAEGEALLRSVW